MSCTSQRRLYSLFLTLALLWVPGWTAGQTQNIPTITTVAGGGPLDNGLAINSAAGLPINVALDSKGNLFFSDIRHDLLRKIDSNGVVTTVAGTGTPGFSGDGGPAINAQINFPAGLAVDTHGNLFFADVANNRVRKVDSNGMITTVAGNGVEGFSGDGGPATKASLGFFIPNGFGASPYLAVDPAGNLYIADSLNFRIRKVDTTAVITTIAGTTRGFSGDGGPAIKAQFSFLGGLAVDAKGNIFITDAGNGRVREINSSGIINTIAGTGIGSFSGDGGPGINADLDGPLGLALDSNGNLFIADETNQRVRELNIQGIINTVAGSGGNGDFAGDGGPATDALLNRPEDVAADSLGNLYIADSINYRIRKVDLSGTITTAAGTGEPNFSGDRGSAIGALLDQPSGVAADGAGNLFISDTQNSRVRKVSNSGAISTILAGHNVEGSAGLVSLGLIVDASGNLFISDLFSDAFTTTGQVQEFSTTGSIATLVSLAGAGDVAVNNQGIWAISDNCIQKILQGSATTVAGVCGTQTHAFGGDGGPAIDAFINFPKGLAVDGAGELFITDTLDHRIRKVDANGIINTIVGTGTSGFSGDGGPALSALINAPGGVRLSGGNLYFADTNNHRVRKVDAGGIITTVVGNGTAGFSGDGGPATGASLSSPAAIAFDSSGNLFVADTGNNRIRKVTIPNFAIVSNPASATIRAGQSAMFTLSITPLNGFTGSIGFACSGLPSLASCDFNPSSITPNGSQANVTLQVNTAGPSASLGSPAVPFNRSKPLNASAFNVGGFLVILAVVFPGAARGKRRAVQHVVIALSALLIFAIFSGCGGSSSHSVAPVAPVPTTPTGVSTVTVTATANQGSVTNVAVITLTVTP